MIHTSNRLTFCHTVNNNHRMSSHSVKWSQSKKTPFESSSLSVRMRLLISYFTNRIITAYVLGMVSDAFFWSKHYATVWLHAVVVVFVHQYAMRKTCIVRRVPTVHIHSSISQTNNIFQRSALYRSNSRTCPCVRKLQNFCRNTGSMLAVCTFFSYAINDEYMSQQEWNPDCSVKLHCLNH